MSLLCRMRYMNPYDIHKELINQYILKKPGDTNSFKRDTSKDKTDSDILRENHKFLWDESSEELPWEQQFAKRYYDKLFKEYCISDLTRYKENKIAMRWRTEQEVISGKGQFICANKRCLFESGLRTWEVNFSYLEDGVKKNALVKIRLCPDCSIKLNYNSQKREVKRMKDKRQKRGRKSRDEQAESKNKDIDSASSSKGDQTEYSGDVSESECTWTGSKNVEVKTREEEMDEYLEDLLL